MNTQQREVMQQALDALEYKGYGSKARTLKKQAAIAALRQALAEPARTFVEPVTDDEIVSPPKEQAMSKNTDLARECGAEVEAGLQTSSMGFKRLPLVIFTYEELDAFAERVLAEQKTLYALLIARVREQDVLIAQMKLVLTPPAKLG